MNSSFVLDDPKAVLKNDIMLIELIISKMLLRDEFSKANRFIIIL